MAFLYDPHRFNVATSRAIDFTFCIFAGIPRNATLIKKYLRHFGATCNAAGEETAPEEIQNPADTRYAWRYHEGKRESEFEVRIDECLHEMAKCEGSCTNRLVISPNPYMVNANRTALVGVRTDVEAVCECGARNYTVPKSCRPNPCLNGGRCTESLYGTIE